MPLCSHHRKRSHNPDNIKVTVGAFDLLRKPQRVAYIGIPFLPLHSRPTQQAGNIVRETQRRIILRVMPQQSQTAYPSEFSGQQGFLQQRCGAPEWVDKIRSIDHDNARHRLEVLHGQYELHDYARCPV